jgi:hypothetical protein
VLGFSIEKGEVHFPLVNVKTNGVQTVELNEPLKMLLASSRAHNVINVLFKPSCKNVCTMM